MIDFDIMNLPKTKVVRGVEGKSMLIHSDSVKCGKTLVGSQMPNPLYLRFENGADAIDGLTYIPLTSWSDFKQFNKKLTNPKTLDELKKKYTTIIFDTVDVAIRWCSKYVCTKYGVDRLNDGNRGYGIWSEYSSEWFEEINSLLNAGYFLYFIAHSDLKKVKDSRTGEEYDQLVPKGDKRTIDLVVEGCDFIGYVKANGTKEDGSIIPSSVYFAETKEFKAGSRFKYMPRYIEVFSATNVQNAISEAVERQEKESGTKSITFEENKKEESKEKKVWEYDDLVKEITKYAKALWNDNKEEVSDIIAKEIGEDVKITETTKKQIPQLEVVMFNLKQLAKDKNVQVN